MYVAVKKSIIIYIFIPKKTIERWDVYVVLEELVA